MIEFLFTQLGLFVSLFCCLVCACADARVRVPSIIILVLRFCDSRFFLTWFLTYNDISLLYSIANSISDNARVLSLIFLSNIDQNQFNSVEVEFAGMSIW